MDLKPLYDRVIIKRHEAQAYTPAGLTIPTSAQGKSSRGVVMAVGNGRLLPDGHLQDLFVKVDDEVMFPKHAGMEITVNNEDYLVLNESEIIAVM